ncbi:hypothetical protein FRB94_006488 [Tulasnella sp. JGI-2019a]|nr:hypothetical protein FRB94_006488 [Tulasnella sp. JGI-2019a]KAG8999136.1 hypothetical protein FRB93_013293 [Tulasnella sp. JGI-2019a]
MPYPPTIQQPTTARISTPRREQPSSPIVSRQPSTAPAMTLDPEQKGESQQTLRMRGGCIPLPGGGMCYIIPCCCP